MTSPLLATLTFNEDFNNLSLWSSSTGKGTWATSYWYSDPKGNGGTLSGNGEQQWYINSDYAATASVKPWTVENGILTLTAAPASAEISQLINGYQYTSGEINTYHSFSQLYGYFEMRAQLPAGQGAWPAFWLLQADGSWPPELDIMEVLGNDPTTLYTTVHTAETGEHTSSGQGTTVSDTSVGFHTYGVDWEADKITWYYDGKQVYQVDTPADMHEPMYIMANLALGGYWGGNVDPTSKLPAQMLIDYIRAYSSMPESATTPPTDTTPPGSPLTLNGNDKAISTLVGGAGADVLTSLHQADTLTGGAGADTFVFKALPWNAGHITDFTVGVDKLDLSALITASGYKGSDPVADGYLSFQSDGHGGTKVLFDIDGKGTANPWPITVTILDNVSPNGLTAAKLFGTASSSPGTSAPDSSAGSGSGSGLSLSGNDIAASVLKGGDGADTLTAHHLADTLTGGAGADTFVFKALPWNAGHITDFTVGVDKLDLSALITASAYRGADLIADGYLILQSNGAGGTKVLFDIDGKGTANPWPITITTLDNVSPAGLTAATLLGQASQTSVTAQASVATAAATVMTLSGNDMGASTLVGGTGADTLTAAHYADSLTGGTGADTFAFKVLPWNAGHVTDFEVGVDKLDLSGLAALSGYKGSDPVGDHYLSFREDSLGNTQVYVDIDGAGSANPWPTLVTTLDHVAVSSLHDADWIF